MKNPIDGIIAELRALQELYELIEVADAREAAIRRRIEARGLCIPPAPKPDQERTRVAIGVHLLRLEQAAIAHILTALDGGARPGWDGK